MCKLKLVIIPRKKPALKIAIYKFSIRRMCAAGMEEHSVKSPEKNLKFAIV